MKRSPKVVLFLLLTFSAALFIYINYCSCVLGGELNADKLLAEAKQNFRFTELDVLIKAIRVFVSILLPGNS